MMLKIPILAALWMLVVVLLTPVQAFAQIPPVVPSPPWGEPINTPDRFVLLASYNNQAVYDQETGLVWERSPSTFSQNWQNAQFACNNKAVGNRIGWRLPTVQELASLVDPTQNNPPLPAGHPFDVLASIYWSASSSATFPTDAWVVGFLFSGFVDFHGKSSSYFFWCVRGGRGVDAQ